MADTRFILKDRRKRNYFTVDNVLLDVHGKELGPQGIAVYTALARFANQESECWPSHATIADRIGMSRRQVMREIAKLEAMKLISITPQIDDKGNRKSNLYTLLDIAGGSDSQSLGGGDTQSLPSDSQSHEQSPYNKYTRQSNNKKGKSYRPEEYADIILG